MPPDGVRFVFSPALYPQSPLSNHTVFVHGQLIEAKQRNPELIVRVKDEKGEWEAYSDGNASEFQPGQAVRAYGLIVPQPDGKLMLAAKWVKKMEAEEYAFCLRQTNNEWKSLLETNPTLATVKPFVLPQPPSSKKEESPKKIASEDEDFVSAHQLKVEKEYL